MGKASERTGPHRLAGGGTKGSSGIKEPPFVSGGTKSFGAFK